MMKRVPHSTWLWAALLFLGTAAIVWQLLHPAGRVVDADDELGAPLVAAAYADWAAVELLYRDERARFERDSAGRWFRHEARAGEAADHAHTPDAAAAERIGAVLATFSRTKVERVLAADPSQLAGYGLANPPLIVLVHSRGAPAVQSIEFGAVAPDQLSRYVHLPQTRSACTIADYQARGLLSLLASAPAAAATPR